MMKFPRENRLSMGYNMEEVDEFLHLAQLSYEKGDDSVDVDTFANVTFDLERGGYKMEAVDAAIDRLLDALVLRERDALIAEIGEDEWRRQLVERAETFRERLERPDGERFRPGAAGERAYDRDDVDELCRRLIAYFGHQHPMSVDDVRHASFRGAKGAKGYDEGVVDVFLDHVATVMAAVP